MATDRHVRVMVVEDEEDMRILIQSVIDASPDFALVGTALDGAEGVRLAAVLQPDVVLLDVIMPRMNGITAMPLIREAAPRARIIFLTVLDGWHLDALAADEDVPPAGLNPDGVIMKTQLPLLLRQLRALLSR